MCGGRIGPLHGFAHIGHGQQEHADDQKRECKRLKQSPKTQVHEDRGQRAVKDLRVHVGQRQAVSPAQRTHRHPELHIEIHDGYAGARLTPVDQNNPNKERKRKGKKG